MQSRESSDRALWAFILIPFYGLLMIAIVRLGTASQSVGTTLHRGFVASHDGVHVLDLDRHVVHSRVPAGALGGSTRITGIAISGSGSTLYAATEKGVWSIDSGELTVSDLRLDAPQRLQALFADDGFLMLSAGNEIFNVDAKGTRRAQQRLEPPLTDIVVSGDGARAYIIDPHAVSVFDTHDLKARVRSTQVSDPLVSGALGRDDRFLYVTSPTTRRVLVFDANSLRLFSRIWTRGEPVDIAFSPDQTRAYIADATRDAVVFVDTTTLDIERSMRSGRRPLALAVDQRSGLVYTADNGSKSISVIDPDRYVTVTTIPLENTPLDVVISAP